MLLAQVTVYTAGGVSISEQGLHLNADLGELKRIILSKLIFPLLTILPSRSQVPSGASLVPLPVYSQEIAFLIL